MRPRNVISFGAIVLLLAVCALPLSVFAQSTDARLYVLNLSADATPKLTVGETEVPLPEPGNLSEPVALAAGSPLSTSLEYMGFASTSSSGNVAENGIYLFVVYNGGQAPQGDVINLAPLLALEYPALDDQARLLVVNQWSGAGNMNMRTVVRLRAGELAVSQVAGSGAGGSPLNFAAASPSPHSDIGLIAAPGTYELLATSTDDAAESYYAVNSLPLTAGNITIVAVSGMLPDTLNVVTVSVPVK